MKSIEENEFLSNFCKENNIELPKNLQNRKIYEEIGSFKDAEQNTFIILPQEN